MRRIAVACEGLHYMGETDTPVEPIEPPSTVAPSAGPLLEFLNREETEPVETADGAEFFERLIEPEWHGETEKDAARRFQFLSDVPGDELERPASVPSGAVRVDVLIPGRTRDGSLAGVRTRAVET